MSATLPASRMDARLKGRFRIGTFEVEPLAGRIDGPNGTQHVQPKVMDVLVYLAEHAGELVERDTLLEQVWRRVTSEEVLTRCISELRRALGDDRASPSYIQTVPKRGYRLLEPVVLPDEGREAALEEPPQEAADAADGPPAPTSAVASVAVLPFDNHSTDPANQFMGDAFAAELLGTLARVDRLRVASRRSAFVFRDGRAGIREIGRQLGVGYVISGSLQCNGTRLHIVAELNDAVSGTQVWARAYDRNCEDLLAIEKEVAEQIVGSFTMEQLRAEISSARHRSTSSLDAWGLVQKARALVLDYTADSLAEAVEPLRRAIDLDENYPAAHAMLSSLLVERLVMAFSINPEEDEAAALDSARRALALAPQDPFILKMASQIWTYCGDPGKAIACLRKAVRYAPFDFGAWGYMGWPLTASGTAEDLAELHRVLDRLLGLEPNHPGVAFWLYHRSVAATCEGRFEAAAEAAEAAVDLRPRFALAWMHYANVLGQLGDAARAREALAQCAELNPALTPRHFAALVRRMSMSKPLISQRLGGLRSVGALRR